ncbi:unnamed protein product [Ectocarpus sp. 6 AP-2014]
MKDRRGGGLKRGLDERLTLVKGVHLVSSSPSSRASGLLELQDLLRKHGPRTRSWIPPSWGLALAVLRALRAGVEPMAAAVCHINGTDPPQPTFCPRNWTTMEEIRWHWNKVQDYPGLAEAFQAGDSAFALESALNLRESGGSLLRHPEGVFLDVEEFALSLAPILNHKEHETDAYGFDMLGGRKVEHAWQLNARRRLFDKGILHSCFARCLWDKDDGMDVPELAFQIMVKLGILLPLPKHHLQWMSSDYTTECPAEWRNRYGSCGGDYLVLMRLPKILPPRAKTCLQELATMQNDWGVAARWEFDCGSAPYGLVERLVASCHVIGDVIPETCWRGGACFVANNGSKEAASGSAFALSIEFFETPSGRRTAGTLTVRVFGNRKGCAVWGALRFVITRIWRLFEEFPGLGWEAWVENPDRADSQKLFYLAGVKDLKGRRPTDRIIPLRAEAHGHCSVAVAECLGKVLRTPATLQEVFIIADVQERGGNDQGNDDEDQRFSDLLRVFLNPVEPITRGNEGRPSMSTPEWLKNVIMAGPAELIALFEPWSPLLQVGEKWRQGPLEEAIGLTVVAVIYAVVVITVCALGVKWLRRRYGWWGLRLHPHRD